MTRKSIITLLLLMAFMFCLLSAAEAKIIVKYGHVGPPVHPQHLGALAFAKYVNEKSNGEIEFRYSRSDNWAVNVP
jgi:TRAP-type C4-dicarboxylate transport system substrate-binding protein